MNANPPHTEPNGGPAQDRDAAGGGGTYQDPNLDRKATIAATLAFLHPPGSVFELCFFGPKPPRSPSWEGYAGGKKP